MDSQAANRLLRFFIPVTATLVLIGVTAVLVVRELSGPDRDGEGP